MPNWKTLGLSYESALRIYRLKGIEMVNYLRERRDPNGALKAFHRRRFLAARKGE